MERDKVRQNLEWFNTFVQYAKGVGPYLSKLFDRLGIKNFEDLLYHIPFRYLDYREISPLNRLEVGKNRCVMGEVFASGEVPLGRMRKKIFEVILTDGKGHVAAKWFHYSREYFKKRFAKGEKFLFLGEVTQYRGERQMVHPDVQPIKEFFEEGEGNGLLGLLPVYSLTEGLNQKLVRKVIQNLIAQNYERIGESLPEEILHRQEFPSLSESFLRVHQPKNDDDVEIFSAHRSPFHKRLIFDEFFYLQLGLNLKKRRVKAVSGFTHKGHVKLRNSFLTSLPFELTSSQLRAIDEISFKMCSSEPMNVLLQGDVGSGKTIVAMLAALLAIENERQVALMVPTEILAEQHLVNFRRLLEPFGVQVNLLTSSTKLEARKEIFQELEDGTPMILIGTHALLEGEVNFEKLSLVIIDEQHRFGVRQRMHLMKKGYRPDVLVMTATPIPRSLAMTLYGDLDLCLMTEMPKGRKPIYTRIMFEKDRLKLYDFIRKKLNKGSQAYFVLPLIEESEKLDLKDATRAYERLKKEFSEFSVALIHGRMRGEQKEEVMRGFSSGEIKILVSTTVIEVGIDVPNATLMIIEHAERFGLSQLHQLRGRVGRGAEKSYCILATGYKKSELAKTRLKVMEENNDGFKIAEEDLKIRGPGDFLGTRQSGIPDLRIANLVSDLGILEEARKYAEELVREDPGLESEEHQGMLQILEHRWAGRLGLAEVG